PARVIPIDPITDRTYHYWHVFVPDLKPGQLYGYRATGPFDPAQGLRFDPTKLLLDPYGRGVVVPDAHDRKSAAAPGDNSATAMKSVLVDPSTYDWEGDAPPRHPSARTIIYEMHVAAFTRNPNSGVPAKKRGTYAGLIEKIPYLKDLGITAVELLPVFAFDAQDCPEGVVNFWGYQPVSFFSPHPAYSSRRDPLGPIDEFRDMVKALHRAGIEVLLDVVFNHTSEGGQNGPTLCFRGLANNAYYILDEQDKSRYADFSGCGNTLNANHPIVRRMIVDSLKYWVEQMHVDGFRFDLASILSRDPDGRVLPNPPILWDIESDPVLAGTKLIAEAWDAAGLYQVGGFVGDTWKEWNGRFRDDTRDFFRGVPGSLRRFADRFVGSPELYRHENREPEQSVNFVTCHDGFTLNDLVSYNDKHNEANNDGNRDGCNDNRSWNCGVEGPTDDPAIEKLRNRQCKNFLTATILSLGVPMILMGDEVRRTQHGNNNCYCHDSEISWFDWSLVKTHADVFRFTRLLIERRLQRSIDHEHQRVSLGQMIATATKSWHGCKLGQPDWSDNSHSFALTATLARENRQVHLIWNGGGCALDFELPQVRDTAGGGWRRWIDTSLDSPDDIVGWQSSVGVSAQTYPVPARSVVVLFAESSHGQEKK
ncbi:MAG TPA: glycogen debranching protein GlgX, partial [Tepidisphaeraceae bacterium]|nr:glycogen debranching protein GlgX [Tepidisphaeraceae bacterium]